MFKKYALFHWAWFWVACCCVSGVVDGVRLGSIKFVVLGTETSLIMSVNIFYSGVIAILIYMGIGKIIHITKDHKAQGIEAIKT